MSKKVLANDGLAPSAVERLMQAGFEVTTNKVPQEELAQAINAEGYDVVLVRSATTVRKDVIDACQGLKVIGRAGVGMDNIDVSYAREQGRHVINTPAASSQSVAELVTGSMFAISRFTYDAYAKMPVSGADRFDDLKKSYAKGIELRGKTLGIVGFGRIGQWTARYAVGVGMHVIAADPFVKEDVKLTVPFAQSEITIDIKIVSMDDLLAQSDFISLHVPKQKDGGAVIGAGELEKMKNGVRIVNAARGGVIDEQALQAAIASGKVAAAALDVFNNEPTPDPAFLASPRLALTPHIGAATLEAQDRIGLELADQIIDLLG